MNTIEPTLIKKKDLAKRLSVSTRTIDAWVGKRLIPYIQITPRFYLYEFDAVLVAIRKHYQVEPANRAYQAEGIVIAQTLEQGSGRFDHQEPLPFLHVIGVLPLAAFRMQYVILRGRARPKCPLENPQRIVLNVCRRVHLRCRGGRLVNVLHPWHKRRGAPPPTEPTERHDCEGDEK